MPSYANFAAMAQAAGVSPQTRTKAKWLLSGQEGEAEALAAEPADAQLALNPVFSEEPQGFSMAGNAPVGGGSSAASALLGNAAPVQTPSAPPPQAPMTQQEKMRRFEETMGGQTALALLEKKKKLKWWMPSQFADRNERSLQQALDVARLEMAGDEGQARSAQWLLEQQDRKLSRESAMSQFAARDENEDLDRALNEQKFSTQAELERTSLDLKKQQHEADVAAQEAAQKSRARALALDERREGRLSSQATGGGQNAQPAYDVYADDPAATGEFKNFAKGLVKDNPLISREEADAAKVSASRAGALPPMMSTPADRPITATGPNGQKLILKNGRWVPAQ